MDQLTIKSSADQILGEMELANYGGHDLIIYPNPTILTKIYSQYIKSRLQANMELILFLSTYQSVNQVRSILKDIGLDLAGYEQNGSLVILDSARGFFGADSEILLLIKVLSKRAQNQGKVGSSKFADMGLFNLFRQEKDLLRYEVSMPPKFDGHINNPLMCKAFCMYHLSNLDRLSETEKAALFEHHHRKLIIADGC
jgi:hypothetical protein